MGEEEKMKDNLDGQHSYFLAYIILEWVPEVITWKSMVTEFKTILSWMSLPNFIPTNLKFTNLA